MNLRTPACLGRCINSGFVECDSEACRKFARKVKVGIGFFAPKAMVKVSGMKHQAQFPAAIHQRAKERDGVRAPGKAHGKTHTGLQERGVERELGRRRAHERMIVQFSILDPCY